MPVGVVLGRPRLGLYEGPAEAVGARVAPCEGTVAARFYRGAFRAKWRWLCHGGSLSAVKSESWRELIRVKGPRLEIPGAFSFL